MFYNLRRRLRRKYISLRHKIDVKALNDAFDNVGLEAGMVVCAHSSLSQLGFIEGGPASIIDTLQTRLTTSGCLMMPSFPTAGAMADYISSGQVFDVRSSRSRVGALTEIFRKRPDVARSLHPTNSVAAWGQPKAYYLADHEKSITPYGRHTPFGRLAESDNTFILIMETHIHSYLHHLQERVDFPNIHLPGLADAKLINTDGQSVQMQTKVMRPRIPYFVAIPSRGGAAPDWAVLHDFFLLFTRAQAHHARAIGYRFAGYPKIGARRQELEASGILRSAQLGRGEIGLLNVRAFTERVEPEIRDLIERFRPFYDPDSIAALNLPY